MFPVEQSAVINCHTVFRHLRIKISPPPLLSHFSLVLGFRRQSSTYRSILKTSISYSAAMSLRINECDTLGNIMHRRFEGVGGILGRWGLCVNKRDRARVIEMDAVNTKSG